MARRAALLLGLLAVILLPARATAQPLVFDLSSHLIAITTGFAGTDVLLYGAVNCEAACDVAVVVRGPRLPTMVWRKARIGPIWVNSESLTFNDVPSYYHVATSRPLDEIAPLPVRQRHQIGLDMLELEPARATDRRQLTEFRDGLVRGKIREALFSAVPGRVAFLGTTLFRTRVFLPANVVTGSYSVEVFLFQQGEVIAAQTIPMLVNKAGVGAEVFEFAHRYAALYGIVAILISVAAGWGAGIAFRKN